MAVNLRYRLYSSSNKSSQFSHKQLVLVATPVSTGVYFFIYLPQLKIPPVIAPAASAAISPASKERCGIRYSCTNSIPTPYSIADTVMSRIIL